MAKKLGMESLVIKHNIANMVCNVTFVAHNQAYLLGGYSPFLFPNLTNTEAQQLLSTLFMWDTHLTEGSCSTMAETKQVQ